MIDFAAMFATVEADDDQTSSLADVLDILKGVWPDRPFRASDVAKLVNSPGA